MTRNGYRKINMNSGIYYIENTETKKGYIGSSKYLNKRFRQHLYELEKGIHKNRHLQSSFDLYGKSSFIFKILATCPEEYLLKLEQWFLDNAILNCEYNICQIAGPPPKLIFTKEIRQTMSESSIKRANSLKEKERLKSLAVKNWSNPEHKKFMQNINRGEKHPQAILTEEIATLIKRELITTPEYYGKNVSIAKKYNITVGMTQSIKYGKSWNFINID